MTKAEGIPETPGAVGGASSGTALARAGAPIVRPRRLRQSAAMRRQMRELRVDPAELILPMFVREGIDEPREIGSMPGVFQHTEDSLRVAAEEAASLGVGGLMLFGVPETRDECGSAATSPDGILNRATRALAADLGNDIVIQTDLCLDEFTSHGHCGVLAADGSVDNDVTLERYAEMAIAQAEAGSSLLGMSGMMDGQVAVARAALDEAGFEDVLIMAYSAKYATALYGPFREAVDSQLKGDRRTYQMDPANRREGLREAMLDVEEGADVVMVKPATYYLDVLSDVAEASPIPVWAYHVSGEYSMIEAAARNGWISREAAALEAITSIRRAGADAVMTYYAVEAARWLRAEGGLR